MHNPSESAHPAEPKFLFATCQADAGDALKRELARCWPELRLAFSRPGFLTFKLPAGHPLVRHPHLEAVFARASGVCVGKVRGTSAGELASAALQMARDIPHRAMHVWQRGWLPAVAEGMAAGESPLAAEARDALARCAAGEATDSFDPQAINRTASRGQWVLDVIVVDPNEWWIGYHRAITPMARFPGGMPPTQMPEDAVSRAYLKMDEALLWSRLPIQRGDMCVELGSAPGGASQALLARGMIVTGIDPADMNPAVLSHPNFRHVKMRGADLRRKAYRKVRWLFADVNLRPEAMLRTVESIVTHREVHVRGMLLNLKLASWDLADRIPDYLAQVRGWGYRDVRVRQLAYNRREVCLAALKHRSLRRLGPMRAKRDRNPSTKTRQPSG